MLADTLKWTWRAKLRLLSLSILLISFSIKFRKFCFLEIKCQKRPFSSFWPEYFEVSFEGGPLWLVWLFWQVRPKYPFQFDKTVVPNTALLYPADNYCVHKQMRSGLGWVCTTGIYVIHLAHGISEISNKIFAEWKAPFLYNHVPVQTNPLVKRISLIPCQITVFLSLPRSRFCLVTQWALCCVTRIKRLWGRLSFPNK